MPVGLGRSGAEVDAKGQDSVDHLGFGVADHGEVREVTLRLFAESLPFWTFDRWYASSADSFGTGAESGDHFLWVEGRHGRQRTW